MKERGSGIKVHPFTDKEKFPAELEIQSLIQRCGENTKKHCSYVGLNKEGRGLNTAKQH